MRRCLMSICFLTVGAAAPSAVYAQRIATGVVSRDASQLPLVSFAPLGALPMMPAHGRRPVVLWAMNPAAGVEQADSVASRDTHAEAGAIIGGLVGAVAGGLAFAHWTHRAGAVNSGTGTLGGTVVGAGLIGGVGPLAGPLIGSAIPHLCAGARSGGLLAPRLHISHPPWAGRVGGIARPGGRVWL